MGLSSSKTKTTQNSSQNSNQTETGTTTPVTPDWLTQAAQDYVGRIGAFGDMDPNGFVAPAAPLHQMAWQNAGSLGDWKPQAATASNLAYNAGQGAPHFAGTGGAMGRWAGAAGLTPDVQLSGGGAAHLPAIAPGSGKALPATGGEFQRPAGAFSGAASQQAMPAGPAYTYQAPTIQAPASPTAYQAGQTSLGAAPQIGGQSYAAPQLANPGLVSGQSYSAPQLGAAGTYAAARTGAPIGAESVSYNPAFATPAAVAPSTQATAYGTDPASLLTNLDGYQNPYRQQVVDATLADYDHQTGRALAANQAAAARNGALGGSRYAIEDAALQGELARGRATLEGNLLSQGFNTAAGLSQSDAGLRQQAGLFNAQNQTGISQFNAGQDAARALGQAGFVQQASLANQDAQNATSQFGAAARNASQAQYADAANRAALDYGGRADAAAQLGLNLQQQRDLAQAGYSNEAARYGAESGMQAALANQGLAGQYGLAQAGLSADAARYGADSNMQAALANQGLAGQYGLARFGAETGAAGNYAAALNAAGLAGYQGALGNAQLQAQLAAQAGQYNAGANNQMSQFNAGQADNAYARQLQAAGMLGSLANDYGAGTRSDLATMAQLGDQQRAIEQAYAMAGPAQLQLMGQLSGMTPYDILVGRNVSGNTIGSSSGTGTTVTTESPSLFNMLMQAGNSAARAYAGGFGG